MINGDKINSFKERILYFPQCVSNFYRHELSLKKENWHEINPDNVFFCTGTPARITCNTFWYSIDYQLLKNSLKNKLHFMDIGTGAGDYGLLFENLTKENFGSYTGIDIYKNENFPKKFNFILSKAENADKHLSKKTNFVISQSALEHIEKDVETLIKVTTYLTKSSNKFIQIHLVPAPASLPLYLWHGWRQYSLRNLSKISKYLKEISPNLEIKAIALGGYRSFYQHLKNHTLQDLFNSKTIQTFAR